MDASHRVFKDDNHKPELMVALSDFWLLHGFQSLDTIKAICQELPPFNALLPQLTSIKEFYSFLMNMDQGHADSILHALENHLETIDTSDKDRPHFWAKRAFSQYGKDKGIFSIYFFNLVHLKEGEAIYQEAGIPHAYLEGQNVEIMANSDNVFRAGLTPKHIDINLLLSHLDFSPVDPVVIQGVVMDHQHTVYKSPAKEFEVQLIHAKGTSTKLESSSPECYFCMEGQVTISNGKREFSCSKGDAFFVEKGESYTIESDADYSLYRAIVP